MSSDYKKISLLTLLVFPLAMQGGARIAVNVWDDDGEAGNRDHVEELHTRFRIGAANVQAKQVSAKVTFRGRTR